MTKRVLQTFSLFLTALVVAGCDPVSEDSASSEAVPTVPIRAQAANQKHIILLLPDTSIPFQAGQSQALALVATRLPGVSTEVLNAGGSAAVQLKQIQEATAKKPFALLVRPIDEALLEPSLEDAMQSGILVIGLDVRVPGHKYHSAVYCDQRLLGNLAGQIAVHALEIKAREENRPEVTGRVVQIRGAEDSELCNQRAEGFNTALRAHPGVIVVHDAPGFWAKEDAGLRIQEALRLQSSADVVYAHNDAMALGAARAAAAFREIMLFIGTDAFKGDEGGITLVKNGTIDATIYQPLLVDFAWEIIRKKLSDSNFQPKPEYELKPEIATPKNIDEVSRKGWQPFPSL